MDSYIIVSNSHGYNNRKKKPIGNFLGEDNSVKFQSLNSLL